MSKRVGQISKQFPKALIVEAAWEVCNQVGGIYTVIRSKAPCMVDYAGGNYCMVGPYINKNIQAELEPLDDAQVLDVEEVSGVGLEGLAILWPQP